MRRSFFFSILIFCSALFSDEPYPAGIPWFTGPLLTPLKQIVPAGFISIQPYCFYTTNNGYYDNHWHAHSNKHNFYQIFQQTIFEVGLNSFMDTQIFPGWYYNWTEDASSGEFADFPVALNFQILKDPMDPRVPTLLIQVRESFPTGRYQKLDPDRLGTDGAGSGTYKTQIGFTASKFFHFGGPYYLSLRWNTSYQFAPPTDVKGLSVYGGDECTDGRVRPGNLLQVYFSYELSLSQNWAIATDFNYYHQTKDRFWGCEGGERVGLPDRDQFSLAPALEYSFTETIGVNGGVWFSFAGKNTNRFISAVASVIAVF
jgi:hypothetical protein